MSPFLLIALGVVCAALGGEWFVRGSVGGARWLRVPSALIGVTVAAFATSSPELSVSINAALEQQSQIALGDALGSNVVNIALILAIALLIAPMSVSRAETRRDFLVALATPALIGVLAADGQMGRIDGLLLISAFFVWLAFVVRQAVRGRVEIGNEDTPMALPRVVFFSLAGLGLLILAGRLIVEGAKSVGDLLDLDTFVVGATLVAIGTSVPELAATLIARLRGHDEIGLGNVLGSNIFNGLLIVGIAALITPIPVALNTATVGLGFGLLSVAMALPLRRDELGRGRGLLLLACYAAYLVLTLTLRA